MSSTAGRNRTTPFRPNIESPSKNVPIGQQGSTLAHQMLCSVECWNACMCTPMNVCGGCASCNSFDNSAARRPAIRTSLLVHKVSDAVSRFCTRARTYRSLRMVSNTTCITVQQLQQQPKDSRCTTNAASLTVISCKAVPSERNARRSADNKGVRHMSTKI